MTDRILARAWWLVTMCLIAATGTGALCLGYRGVFNTFAGAYVDGAIFTLCCFPVGGACYLLCRHRNDLVGD